MSFRKAFTLIELLVVIAIIGILATVSIVNFNSAKMKARDAKRKSDLATIQQALEMYYDDKGNYPKISGWAFSTDDVSATNSGWGQLQNELKDYTSKLPVDPVNKLNSPNYSPDGPWREKSFVYAYGRDTANFSGKYDLVAKLENPSDQDRTDKKCWKFHTAGQEYSWVAGENNQCSLPIQSIYYSAWAVALYADH